MKYFSTFSGIGGFEKGIEQAYERIHNTRYETTHRQKATKAISGMGAMPEQYDVQGTISCVGYSEIDKYATQIYEKHFPTHHNFGDITKINEKELPDFDLLVGGFPCPTFSIAGKRAGFADPRGQLILDVLRIAKAKEPMFMLLENVKGLVSHDGGKTLEVILENLQELGYYINYEIRNSKDYGVPQNRERIFLLCKHIKLLSSVGQSEKITTSESIIQEWLFTLLLNNLAEVKKLQGHASKDWILGYLICREISQNPNLFGENILDGISMDMVEKFYQSKGNPWQNIATWLRKNSEENLSGVNKSTISTALKQIIESKTYTYSKMLQAILLATALLRQSSSHLWNEVLSSLILVQEDTKYARINNKSQKAIITESGTAHLSAELQDPTRYFTLSHLRGTPRPEVFPIGGADAKDIEQLNNPAHSNDRVYDPEGISSTLNTMQGGMRQPFIKIPEATKKGYAEAHVGDAINLSVMGSKTRRGRVSATAQTLDTGMQQHTLTEDMQIRRLTPTECERLQGFPDGWTLGVSDTQRYKTCGNAVTVNVVQAVMERLLINPLTH